MKIIFTLLFLLTIGNYAKSQTDTTIQYYDDYWRASNKRNANYILKTYTLENGKVGVEKSYKSGNLIDKVVYKTPELLVRDGAFEDYHFNGLLKEKGNYSNDLREGNWIFYNRNGRITEKGAFKEGLKSGTWEFYNEQGELIRKCGYANGGYHGDYLSFSYNQKMEEGKYVDNQEMGLWKGWYKNGQLKYEGNYDAKGRTGDWTYYYPSGAVASTDVFTSDSDSISTYYNEAGKEIPYNGEKGVTQPEFVGGNTTMSQFIMNTVMYPEVARENGEQGIIYVQFMVMRDGVITAIKILKGISPSLDAEALRVVEAMPLWNPGTLRGRPIKVSFTLPIHFRLG